MADERSPLEAEIRRLIAVAGPMPIADYMRLCLTHPQYGYYLTHEPIGAAGDFITAPEISQMFGELIGLWCADLAARADGDDDAAVLASEYQGLQLARWTSNHKHTDLMTARAWFSRGLAALLVAAVLASGARALTTTAHSPPATGSGYTQVHR